jgi:SAM-dependent methyltransferase
MRFTTDDPEVLRKMREGATNEIERIYYSHEGRLIHKWHHYLEIYDRHFSAVRERRKAAGQPVRILEIGVFHGGSLALWRKYFGPEAVVFGIDVDPRTRDFADDCQVRIGDQSNAAFLASVVDEMGGLDIVVDDGSHDSDDQVASFKALFPRLSPDGVYLCEDLRASYRKDYVDGRLGRGAFINLVRVMIDELPRWWIDGMRTSAVTQFDIHEKVDSFHVYDGVVVIELKRKSQPFSTLVGYPSRPMDRRPAKK